MIRKTILSPCVLLATGAVLVSLAIPANSQAIKAVVTATPERLDTVMGTHAVKVAFTVQEMLYYVDFAEATPQIRRVGTVSGAYYPVISPDGKWVTYQTDVELEGPSTVPVTARLWICELAANGTPVKIADTGFVPRFVLNTPADTPQVIYATSVACQQVNCFTVGKTIKKKIVNKAPLSAEVVCDFGSYYGGISWDNRYLSTAWPAGPNAFMLDLQGGGTTPSAVHTMRVLKNVTDADTAVAIGTCNISRSASRVFTNTMLYFDFSSAPIKAAGCFHPLLRPWKTHEKLFISRYDAQDLKVFDMPSDRPVIPANSAEKGEVIAKEWNLPEWSNHPYYATACLLLDRLYKVSLTSYKHTQNNETVYGINLKDSVYVKLVETTDTALSSAVDIKYPFMWVDIPAGFTEDTTWLSKTIWERAQAGVKEPGRHSVGFNPIQAMLSNANPPEIRVYSLLGRTIASIKPKRGVRFDLQGLFPNLKAGVYLIGFETPRDKQRYVIRWVKVR
jgi:hypothetical protein